MRNVRRFYELDSLRGLAALTVLIGHCFNVVPYIGNQVYDSHLFFLNLLKFTPLTIVKDGPSGVFLFFVLSGFVLSLPYHNGKYTTYKSFIIRRIFRLYIPFLLILFFAIVIRSFISYRFHPMLSTWFNDQWHSPVTVSQILHHVAFVLNYTFGGGHYDIAAFDSVVWSLVQEMRVSIIFPFIVFLVIRLSWIGSMILAVASSLIFYVTNFVGLHFSVPYLIKHMIPFASTLEYIPMFIVGALLSRNWNSIVQFINSKSALLKPLMAVVGVLVYTEPTWMQNEVGPLHISIVQDWFVLLGSSLFILLALSSNLVSKVLHTKPILHIGKVSYSLYLIHLIILVSLMQLFYGKIPLWTIWSITLVSALLVASVSYKYVELPCINIGGRVSTQILTKKRNADKAANAV